MAREAGDDLCRPRPGGVLMSPCVEVTGSATARIASFDSTVQRAEIRDCGPGHTYWRNERSAGEDALGEFACLRLAVEVYDGRSPATAPAQAPRWRARKTRVLLPGHAELVASAEAKSGTGPRAARSSRKWCPQTQTCTALAVVGLCPPARGAQPVMGNQDHHHFRFHRALPFLSMAGRGGRAESSPVASLQFVGPRRPHAALIRLGNKIADSPTLAENDVSPVAVTLRGRLRSFPPTHLDSRPDAHPGGHDRKSQRSSSR